MHNFKDKNLLIEEGISGEKIHVLTPYFLSVDANRTPDYNTIIFYGAMNRITNCEAAIWFATNVMPLLKDTGVRFCIIGAKPDKKLNSIKSTNVIVTGFVDSIIPYFEQCMCMVCPLKNGAGIKVKVLEALSAGVPVLSNSIGIEGIGAVAGKDYLHCETPENYANAITKIIKREIKIDEISSSAKKFMRSNFSLENSLKEYKEMLEKF